MKDNLLITKQNQYDFLLNPPLERMKGYRWLLRMCCTNNAHKLKSIYKGILPCFFLGQFRHFIFQHGKCFDQFFAGFLGFYYFINKSSFGCQVRRGEFFSILSFFFSKFFCRICSFCIFLF